MMGSETAAQTTISVVGQAAATRTTPAALMEGQKELTVSKDTLYILCLMFALFVIVQFNSSVII